MFSWSRDGLLISLFVEIFDPSVYTKLEKVLENLVTSETECIAEEFENFLKSVRNSGDKDYKLK